MARFVRTQKKVGLSGDKKKSIVFCQAKTPHIFGRYSRNV